MVALISTLSLPDDESWHTSNRYSHEVADALTRAYSMIGSVGGLTAGFLRAAVIIIPYLKARMSRRQRMHSYYVLVAAYGADGQYHEALRWAARALEIASHLDDAADMLELLTIRASLHRGALEFREAIADQRDCLAILDEQREVLGLDDPGRRLHAFQLLATSAFVTAQPDLAETAISEVRALAPHAPGTQLDQADTEWVQAHLYRTYAEPERALRHALAFREVYIQHASPVSQDRLEFFVAETALDFANLLGQGSDRSALVTLARPHLERAEQLARDTHDRPGQALSQIARVHYSRLRGSGLDRVRTLESVIRTGRQLNDVAVQAQALTALGDEHAASGERESSLVCYRQAIDLVRDTQVPVLAVPAQRALWRAQEMDQGMGE